MSKMDTKFSNQKVSQSASPKKVIKYSNSIKNNIQGQVLDENMLMLNFMGQEDLAISSNTPQGISPITSPDKGKSLNDSPMKVKSLFSDSKIFQQYVKEKETQANTGSMLSGQSQLSGVEAAYEKKINSLNHTIMKLNDLLEKNMRKISSQEKEILFINKRLREAENLNMRMLGELSSKTQAIESLNLELRKKKDDKVFNRKSREKDIGVTTTIGSGEQHCEVFIKSITEMFLKELNLLSIKASKDNAEFEGLFDEVKMTFKRFKEVKEDPSLEANPVMEADVQTGLINSSNYLELNISQNIYLKNMLKILILNSDKTKKFNSTKLTSSKYFHSLSTGVANLSKEDVQNIRANYMKRHESDI